jgi:uncharacterized membrane protein HdeD (DUF308 family)
MKPMWGQLKAVVERAAKEAKVRKGLVSILAVVLILQIYFVRELLAAEALFVLLFAVLLVMTGIFYVLGTVGERAIDIGEASARVIAHSTKRGYGLVEEIGKKSLRHPHSESAQ